MEEILSLAINQDGGVEELEIRGGVKLEIVQPDAAHIFLKLKNVPKDLQSQVCFVSFPILLIAFQLILLNRHIQLLTK